MGKKKKIPVIEHEPIEFDVVLTRDMMEFVARTFELMPKNDIYQIIEHADGGVEVKAWDDPELYA